jgi:hypothetical protein
MVSDDDKNPFLKNSMNLLKRLYYNPFSLVALLVVIGGLFFATRSYWMAEWNIWKGQRHYLTAMNKRAQLARSVRGACHRYQKAHQLAPGAFGCTDLWYAESSCRWVGDERWSRTFLALKEARQGCKGEEPVIAGGDIGNVLEGAIEMK